MTQTKPTNKTIRALKIAATRHEYKRVYDDMSLPPRDIIVEHNGCRYIRRAWQSLRDFGWGKWEEAQ